MRVLALGTYPIAVPLHGGQRRVAAIAALYAELGVPFRYLSVYDATKARDPAAGPLDFPLTGPAGVARFRSVPFVTDVVAGLAAAGNEDLYRRIAQAAKEFRPTHIELEQPFLYPFAKRFMAESGRPIPLIYSSQNVEAPLKRRILADAGVNEPVVREATDYVEALEKECLAASAVVVAASRADADSYRAAGHASVILCRNGVSDVPVDAAMTERLGRIFPDVAFACVVGSAYPPNIQGALRYLIDGGTAYLPPERRIAVGGGMAGAIARTRTFKATRHSVIRRIQLFRTLSDGELGAIRAACHAYLLPIATGGGSNLKTAEALVSGKWVVGTSVAFRGFEEFASEPGVIVQDSVRDFRRALVGVLAGPPLSIDAEALSRRATVRWERSLVPFREWIAAEGARLGPAG